MVKKYIWNVQFRVRMKELCPRKDAPLPEVPTQVGRRSELPADLIKTQFGSGLLDSDPNYSKLVGNLKNKSWRGFLLG